MVFPAGRSRVRVAARAFATCVALVFCSVLALPAPGLAATPKTITVAADAPETGNCRPFGESFDDMDATDHWTPYFGFVYQNLPAFHLKTGDVLGFDLGATNDHDFQADIALAPANNGTDVNSAPFTTVVTNNQTPRNPRGDDVEGDYEMGFVSAGDFNFAGGGLIIRFSNPGPSFARDGTCDGNLVGAADGTDSSGFFVSRVFTDADGVSPWDEGDEGPIAQFRVILSPTSNQLKLGKVKRSKRRGTATLFVNVPGPGSLSMSGKGVKRQTSAVLAQAGNVKLLVKPRGTLRKRLGTRNSAKTRLRVTFTPGGDPPGDPATSARKIKLVKAG
jgi:hypothetical protein